jgi:glycosyltransferase involved in cell wall biosynthesis
MTKNKLKINVIGTIFGTSGYDSHTRGLVNGLYKYADVKLITNVYAGWERNVNDAELEMITKKDRKEDVNIIVSIPHTWKLYTTNAINCGYCVWEGSKCPSSWIFEFQNEEINLIFTPSNHTRDAMLITINESNLTKEEKEKIINKIKIIPHGADLSIFHTQQKKKDKDDASNVSLSGDPKQLQGKNNKDEDMPVNVDTHSADNFVFICNKGWRGTDWDRGGVQYVIKAFAEEFKEGEPVELLCKLNPAYINEQILSEVKEKLNLPEGRAVIKISLDNIPFEKLVDFYNKGDIYVCATRSEAFNLGGIEAMACGLPTIQTNFGGQIDYMTDKNSLFINYKLEEVKEDVMYEGVYWATPDIEDLRKKMRWAFNNKDIIKQMGKQAEEDSKKWTWDNSASLIIKCLEV